MKQKTSKEVLADSFLELAASKPIDKITVKQITQNCGFSTATFYRHFNDKYVLIAWIYARDVENIMNRYEPNEEGLRQAFIDSAVYYSDNKEYLKNLLHNTSGYDHFFRYMMEINYSSLMKGIARSGKEMVLDEEAKILCRLYVNGSALLTCEWILGRYQADTSLLAKAYELAIPEALKQYLQ